MSTLNIEAKNAMLRYSRLRSPEEACGLIFVKDDQVLVVECNNVAEMRRWEYSIPSIEQARLLDHWVHGQGYSWWGIWHSHPNENSKCYPSPKDQLEAAYEELNYVIVLPRDDEIRVFNIEHHGEFTAVTEVTDA